jgi:1,4-alpha-glucan branching enzyme
MVLVAVNLTPVPRHGYRIGVPVAGLWTEVLNTDAEIYGGSGVGNLGGVGTGARAVPHRGAPHSIEVSLPPLAAIVLKHGEDPKASG